MATSTATQPRIGGGVDDDEEQHGQLVDCFCERLVDCEHAGEAMSKRVSRLAVEGGQGSGGGGGGGIVDRSSEMKQGADGADHSGQGGRRSGVVGVRTLPPPHAWLAIEDTKKKQHRDSDPEEQWMRLLRGGGAGSENSGGLLQQRRSSFSVVRRERAAREAWLDRAWEMKRSWHERNGGAPDADTPVVVVVGKDSSSSSSSSSQQHAGAVGSGVAMDVEEVRACRDLGLELPSDCTVEIQCYGLSGEEGSPTHTAASSSGADSPCGFISSPGADPVDVKARLKVWAHAVALASTTQLGS